MLMLARTHHERMEALNDAATDQIEALKTELAEVTRQRDMARRLSDRNGPIASRLDQRLRSVAAVVNASKGTTVSVKRLKEVLGR